MNKEEVREHFKDAKVVECLSDGLRYIINKESLDSLEVRFHDSYYVNSVNMEHGCPNLRLSSSIDGFAKIIEYKEKVKTKSFFIDVPKGMEVDVLTFKKIDPFKGFHHESTLVPDGFKIDRDSIKFEKIEKELPNSWNEYTEQYCHLSTTFRGTPDRYISLAKLELLRDCYNDGWVAEWSDFLRTKFCICFHDSDLITENYTRKHHFLNFKTAELRDKFLENFKDIIEIAKPLL